MCKILLLLKNSFEFIYQINELNYFHIFQLEGIGETAAIFKNGDDLRQDMLTLQASRFRLLFSLPFTKLVFLLRLSFSCYTRSILHYHFNGILIDL